MANHWFAYDGVGNPYVPASYLRTNIAPNCDGGCKICAVYLDDNSLGNPSTLGPVLTYIANALITQVAQPAIPPIFTTLRSC